MTKSSFSQLSLWSLALASYLGETLVKIGPVGDLIITNADVGPDGYTRMAVLAGSTINGELIVGQKGDDFAINVINNLNDSSIVQSTSIHWHGLVQRGTSWADGTAFVTGWPISHNNSLYKFNAGDQAGTFWYHSHLSTQYCEGLRGPMIICDSLDPHTGFYDVDDENTIITLSDWNHVLTKTLKEPTSDATLINGLGCGDPTTELAIISVKQGTRYRFRLINMACGAYFTFSIERHLMKIIELRIFVGKSSSFDWLDANQDVQNYCKIRILSYLVFLLYLKILGFVPTSMSGSPGFPEQEDVDYSWTLNMLYRSTLLPAGSVYALPPNSTIELSVPGFSVGHGHAFHLHGHTFDVIRTAGSSTYNYENPVRRDVVHIGDIGANVTIRFKTDNAGPWLFHCHTNWHLNKGFAVVFAEDTEWENLCSIYDALPASEP
ncbi:laccase [Armillaria borealis]|uniref:Laccase n=1 Tax=Armillaria borealis TaxID=47425 RepID=A0AA39JTH7_9AGAR|nr:laccase [Armillaria borealis]